MFLFRRFIGIKNYPTGNLAEAVAKKIIKVIKEKKIVKIESTRYTMTIFTKKEEITFWNVNKYYAFFSEGEIEKGNTRLYWENEMPSRKTLYKLKKALDNYFEENL